MNLFRKILSSLICTLLLSAVWAQTQYPDPQKTYTAQEIKGFIAEYEEKNDSKGIAIAFELQGMFYQRIYFFSTLTLTTYFKSADHYLKVDDLESHYRVKKRLADLFSIDDVLYINAPKFYIEAFNYYEAQKNEHKVTEVGLEMLNLLINKDSLRGNAQITRFPNVKLALDSIIEECQKRKDASNLTYAYNLYASYSLQKKQLDAADRYIDLSLKINKSKTQFKLLNLFQKGLIQKAKNNLPEAISLLRSSELIAEIRNNKYLMQHICQNLAECYTLLKNQPQALNYWKKTAAAVTRFYNSSGTQSSRNEFTRYELRLVTMEQKLAKQNQRYWNTINYVIILGLIMFGVIAYLVFKSRMREKDLLNRALELKSMKSLIEGQEKERNRVAKDLHDGLGANLSSIKLFIESQKDKYDANIQTQFLNPLAKNIDDACIETRSISHDLRPFSLKYGFNSALGDLVKKAQMALPQTEVIFGSYGDEPPISEEIALMVYRIVQELLNNAAKYAKATQITLQIFYEPEQISVHVEDDGQGFDLQQVKEGNGLGNIRSRIDYLGGQVIWQAAPQQGTAVILSVPLQITPTY
ncbi:sensor histidine kinase [Haliscomenobacter sp.]|uniref:sensor histidine kinase n=1 Tax=Haliscomenobacter sp. TaxID=2717303 RepID=UPI003593F5A6